MPPHHGVTAMRITFAELNAYLPTSPEWPDHYEAYFDVVIDAGIFFNSRNEPFTEWCEQQGFVVADNAVEFRSLDTLDIVLDMCDKIYDEYESVDNDNAVLWKRFGFGGDDAVDYNSGMVSDGIALIREYIKNT